MTGEIKRMWGGRLGPILDLLDPRVDPLDRQRARLAATGFLRRSVPALAPLPTEDEAPLCPWSWRAAAVGLATVDLLVVLRGGSADEAQSLARRLGETDLAVRILWLTATGATGPALGSVVDAEGPGADPPPPTAPVPVVHLIDPYRSIGAVIAGLANAGHFDTARAVAVEQPDGIPAWFADQSACLDACSGLARDDSWGIGAGRVHATDPGRATSRAVARILRRLWLTEGDPVEPDLTSAWSARAFLLQGLRSLRLPPEHWDGMPSAVFGRVLAALGQEAGTRVDRGPAAGSAPLPDTRIVPFYLPQFHPVAENDRWWGEGFTEWHNVASARPQFRGHDQPKLPESLGFYDLRVDQVRARQFEVARAAGVAGFMYYYYWFAGRTILDLPLERHLGHADGLPLCLMWANENWTRRWDGSEDEVLLAQDYDAVPTSRIVADLLPALTHPSYLRVDDRPLLAIYRPGMIPDLAGVVASLRAEAKAHGLDLYLVRVDLAEGYGGVSVADAELFDASMRFPPHSYAQVKMPATGLGLSRRFVGRLWSYRGLVEADLARLDRGIDAREFPSVMVDFDNTARRGERATVWVGSNPYTFRRWLRETMAVVADRSPDARVVFVNAWNEWAEGAILEPTRRHGAGFLGAIRDLQPTEPPTSGD